VSLITEYCKNRFDVIKQNYFANIDVMNVLEVGAGFAWMCKVAKSVNQCNRTVAQDISIECRDCCPWVDKWVIGEVVDNLEILKGQCLYHLISLTHVIEHLPNMLDIMKKLTDLLVKGGVFFITAPHRPIGWKENLDIQIWQKWSYSHVPAHLQYFNEKSIAVLAKELKVRVSFYNFNAEDGQAFEAWLQK